MRKGVKGCLPAASLIRQIPPISDSQVFIDKRIIQPFIALCRHLLKTADKLQELLRMDAHRMEKVRTRKEGLLAQRQKAKRNLSNPVRLSPFLYWVRCLQNTWSKSDMWFEYAYGYLASREREENPSLTRVLTLCNTWVIWSQMSYPESVRKRTSASKVMCCQENEMQGHSLSKFHSASALIFLIDTKRQLDTVFLWHYNHLSYWSIKEILTYMENI